ncbi:MAG TPA: hypothetical protein V6C69_10790 [Trichormus sp.]
MALLALSPPAYARFDLPPVVDEYRVLADTWEVQVADDKPMQDGLSLVVRHNDKSYTWPIEFRYVSDAFSEGKVDDDAEAEKMVLQHIRITQADKDKGPLVIKIAAWKKGGKLFVRSFKVFDVDQSFRIARKFGSPMLNMDAIEIQKIDLKKYRKKITEVTDKDWTLVEQR